MTEELQLESAYFTFHEDVLPTFVVNSGSLPTLDSLPRSDYGGPTARDAEACKQIWRQLIIHCVDHEIAYVRMCLSDPFHLWLFKPLSTYVDTAKGVMELDLTKTNSEFVWNHVFSSETRRRIRNLEKSPDQAYQLQSAAELPEFYRIYEMNIKHLGAVPYDFSFLRRMWQRLYPTHMRVWLLGSDSASGGILSLKDETGSYACLMGIDRQKPLKYSVLWYLCWRELLAAESEGLPRFSLGSTEASQRNVHYRYKQSFGADFRQQYIVYVPMNWKGQLFLKTRWRIAGLWKRIQNSTPKGIKSLLDGKLKNP